MHPMTKAVDELVGRERPYRSGLLERAMFASPEERGRIVEVIRLGRDQVEDDTNAGRYGTKMDRVGRSYVQHVGQEYDGAPLWRRWTPEQVALEVGMSIFLGRLTTNQRDVLRLLFHAGLSVRDAGKTAGVSFQAVDQAKDRALATLRRLLTVAFEDAETPQGGDALDYVVGIDHDAYRRVRAGLIALGSTVGAER